MQIVGLGLNIFNTFKSKTFSSFFQNLQISKVLKNNGSSVPLLSGNTICYFFAYKRTFFTLHQYYFFWILLSKVFKTTLKLTCNLRCLIPSFINFVQLKSYYFSSWFVLKVYKNFGEVQKWLTLFPLVRPKAVVLNNWWMATHGIG